MAPFLLYSSRVPQRWHVQVDMTGLADLLASPFRKRVDEDFSEES